MDFRKISILILFGFFILSCSDKNEKPVGEEPLSEIDSAEVVDSSQPISFESNPTMKGWLDFYKQGNPDMGLGNFELQKTGKLETMEGSISTIYEPNFDSVYLPFLVFNPSKTMYIDLDSYNWVPDENGNAMFEADQEVNLVNIKDKTVTRIGFYGPSHWAEDAFWMNDSVFVLLENDDQNQTSFQLINLGEKTISTYLNTQPLKVNEVFYNDLRLKKKGVEALH